jgi:hypothetical protein
LQEIRNRRHAVLGRHRQHGERPGQHAEESAKLQCAAKPLAARSGEQPQVGPREENGPDDHRQKAERDDHIFPKHRKTAVLLGKCDQVPEVTERKRRQQVGEYGKPEGFFMLSQPTNSRIESHRVNLYSSNASPARRLVPTMKSAGGCLEGLGRLVE